MLTAVVECLSAVHERARRYADCSGSVCLLCTRGREGMLTAVVVSVCCAREGMLTAVVECLSIMHEKASSSL